MVGMIVCGGDRWGSLFFWGVAAEVYRLVGLALGKD